MQATQLADRYLREQVETASPEQLLIMLYDAAIRFLRSAIKAMQSGDKEKSHNNLIRTQNIITELMVTLNMELGGDVAKNLYRLYEYYNYSLVQANMVNDVAKAEEILQHLKDLKRTWEAAIIKAAQESQLTHAQPASHRSA